MRRAAGLLVACAWSLSVARARGDGPLPPNRGDPIRTSDYAVDLFQGPVLATSRITALAGAYTAIGEGAEAIPFNPAAASHRPPYSTTNVDWDISGGITLPTTISGTDFDNSGDKSFQEQEDFVFGTLGGYLQYGQWGIGAMIALQNYGLAQSPILRVAQPAIQGQAQPDRGTGRVAVRFFEIEPVVSYGILRGQIHVGGGLRLAQIVLNGNLSTVQPDGSLADDGTSTDLFASSAVGVQGGVLFTPFSLPIRAGAAARSPLAAGEAKFDGGFRADDRGDVRAGELYLPKRGDLPWELEAGFAVQLWKRPFNIPWYDEDAVPVADTERWRRTKDGQIEPPHKGARRMLKRRARNLPRERVLLTTSALVSGPVENAVGVESMLRGRLERSGQDTSLTLRAAAEAEVLPYWLVLRAGSYLEPSRFRHSRSRVHATGGFQVRLFESDVFGLFDEGTIWRLTTAVDVARDYFAWSAGVGVFR